jgi:hypothetical protein
MKSVMFAAAMLLGTAAYAQDTSGTAQGTMAGGTTVAPSNAAPERDARGIPVISADATAPAGWNQPAGTPGAAPASSPAPTQGSAGPLPPCTRKVTDHCTQTYERNHGPAGGGMAADTTTADTGMAADTGGTETHGKAVHHRRRHR